MNPIVLEGRGLTKLFPGRPGQRRVGVHGVDIKLRHGQVLALVGESGSGKTTVARLLARLLPADHAELRLHGRPVGGTVNRRNLEYRRQVQMIFQDPFASLNPVKTVGHHVRRPLAIHQGLHGADADRAAAELLVRVGVAPAEEHLHRYPHELSGGQRQRVAVAAAIAARPDVLLADEPTSMLDVSIRVEILNLIRDLTDEQGLAVLLITHDLASARYIADDVMVMHSGHVVEHGPADEVLDQPRHPYTRLLLDAIPDPTEGLRSLPAARPGGPRAGIGPACPFLGRCPISEEQCAHGLPPLAAVNDRHIIRCPIVLTDTVHKGAKT
jgi:peptide/nickel transport system ATP-binding protein